MNTKEKIERAADRELLYMFKEGIFYKLYNQDAMLFSENIKQLKIKSKFVKTVRQQVYSCGFPASIIGDIKKQLVNQGGLLNETDERITVSGIQWNKQNEYRKWCEAQQAERGSTQDGPELTDIEKKIAGFQVMHKTPMESVHFIISLQEELHKND